MATRRIPIALLFLFFALVPIDSYSCGEHKVPFGIEVYRSGQPALLCSRPNCFDKMYADCDEVPLRERCNSTDSWIGGIDKSMGMHQPLYLQCCEFAGFHALSDPLYTDVPVRPGEYFEGEEVQDKLTEDVIAFDVISDLRMVKESNGTVSYRIDVRRFKCAQMKRPKPFRPWHWP